MAVGINYNSLAMSRYTMWPFWFLNLAGIYNLIWGLLALFYPQFFLANFAHDSATTALGWQFIGLFVLVYGFGYIIASLNPVRFWPFIFLGFLIKTMVAVFLGVAIVKNVFESDFFVLIFLNCLVWLIPFFLILHLVYSLKLARENFNIPSFEESLQVFKTNHNQSLLELSRDKKVLVVFLRHFGCVFCRQLLSLLEDNYHFLLKNNVVPVLVYMTEHDIAADFLVSRKLSQCDCISDPERELYRSFGLSRGKLYQLFGLRVWWRTFVTGVLKGYGIGNQVGDAFQMSGMFLLDNHLVLKSFIPEYISDTIDISSFIDLKKESV